ncbi:hypothetical protein Tco_1389526 [Tanacetum coccineum]
MDYKRIQEYLPRIHRTRRMKEDLRESYRTLEKRLFHEGRLVTPSFIEANNMLPSFSAVSLKSFLILNEPICPRFVVEFYRSLEVKRDEEERPYIEFTFHERVMDPLDISKNARKEKGKKIASPSVTSSSSLLFDDNEAQSFLEFYDELSDNKDLTKAQREKRGMFKCLNCYVSTITKYLKKQE